MAELSDIQKMLNDDLKKIYAQAPALTPQEFKIYSSIVNQINDPEVNKNQFFCKEPFVSLESLYLQLANRRLEPKIIEEIKSEFLKSYPYCVQLTDEDFAMNENAASLVTLIASFDKDDKPNDYDKMNHLYELLSNRTIKKVDLNYLYNKRALIQIYEFKSNQAKELTETLLEGGFDYSEALYNCWDGDGNYRKSQLEVQIDRWVWYCNLVDEFIIYIKVNFPTWNTMSKLEKNEYIEKLKLSTKLPFIEKNSSLLAYIDFLENYGLNQDKKAKSSYLLRLNLPNITTAATASLVTKHSQLIK